MVSFHPKNRYPARSRWEGERAGWRENEDAERGFDVMHDDAAPGVLRQGPPPLLLSLNKHRLAQKETLSRTIGIDRAAARRKTFIRPLSSLSYRLAGETLSALPPGHRFASVQSGGEAGNVKLGTL